MFSKVMLLVIGAFVIGLVVAGFVFSQTANSPFALTPSTSGVSHTASEIVCDNCIDSQNIKDGGILNQDISNGAAINPLKVSGVNGFYSKITNSFGANSIVLPLSGDWGISNWAGRKIETTCALGGNDDITHQAGVVGFSNGGLNYNRIFNQYSVIVLANVGIVGIGLPGNLGGGWVLIYQEDTLAISNNAVQGGRKLYIRARMGDPSQLEIVQIVSGTGFNIDASGRCFVKVIA